MPQSASLDFNGLMSFQLSFVPKDLKFIFSSFYMEKSFVKENRDMQCWARIKHVCHMGALSQITAVLGIERTKRPTIYCGVNIHACDEADTDVSAEEEAEQTDPQFSNPLDLQLFDPGEKEDLAFLI